MKYKSNQRQVHVIAEPVKELHLEVDLVDLIGAEAMSTVSDFDTIVLRVRYSGKVPDYGTDVPERRPQVKSVKFPS